MRGMKKEKLPALIMAVISVAVLALMMCDVGIRFITKNIIYDRMSIRSKVVLWIVDGLIPMQEGTAVSIDWNELYPRDAAVNENGQPDKAAGQAEGVDQRTDGSVGGIGTAVAVWESFDRQIRGTTQKLEDVITYYCTDGLRNQPRIAELAAMYENLTGWDLVMTDGVLMVNENGFLPTIYAERSNVQEIADSVAGLQELVVSEGGLFSYVQIPGNVCRYDEPPIGAFTDHANENADRLLFELEQRGVSCLDLRQALHASGINHREAFYRTDCHWKVPTAFWAAGVITDYLTQIGEIRFDASKYDAVQYRLVSYENNFLGGNGRALTLQKAEPEDFELYLPDYGTAFSMDIPSRQMELTGDFEEVFLFEAPLISYDYYGEDPYDSFRTRNYPLIRIHNQNAGNNQGKRMLIIRDSFSAPLIPYLAVDIEYVDCMYLKSFDGSVREYIRQTKPDIVLVAYYPPNIEDIDWSGASSTFDFR